MNLSATRAACLAVGLLLVSGCTSSGGGAADPDSAARMPNPSSTPASTTPAVAEPTDVELVDDAVRTIHQDAFAIVSEKRWARRVEQASEEFASSTGDERAMVLGRLAGLLDTHTQFFGPPEPMYGVWFYRFADGLYVVAARDDSLVGSRLVAINGTPASTVERLVRATIPADNASAYLNAAYLAAYVDRLHGLGIVTDPARPRFAFDLANGKRRTVDPVQTTVEAMGTLGVLGAAAGDFTEAVRRRDEPIWWRTDRPSRSFLLSVNDYVDPSAAISALSSAVESRRVDRVVIDLRYLRGGDTTPLLPLLSAVQDPRLERSGGAFVLIGRENESAATVLAYDFDTQTRATLVGEPTPAMADNFLCPCQDVELPDTGYVFSVPTARAGNGDARPSVAPDRAVRVRAVDFFAGRDVALQDALTAGR